MRNYNDFDENFRFLFRSLKDIELKQTFDLEVMRAVEQFFYWYKQGNTLFECELKIKQSYGAIIGDMVMFYIAKNTAH